MPPFPSLRTFVTLAVPAGLAAAMVGVSAPAAPTTTSAWSRCATGAAPESRSVMDSGTDLFCVHLTPAPGFRGANGTVELRRIPGPFTVSPTADGRMRYEAIVEVRDLPAADALGDFDGFAAWIAGPSMSPVRRIGPIGEGRTSLGTIDLNRWLIFVAAEGSGTIQAGELPRGPIILRGQSPSLRRRPADFLEFALGAAPVREGHGAGHAGPAAPADSVRWTSVPMPEGVTMLPAMMRLRPDEDPWLPLPSGTPPAARPRQRLELRDGDTLRLDAAPVMHRMLGRDFVLYGFNGQIPGPLLSVPRAAEITVKFTNHIDWPTAVHWHGIRLDNASDGVPFVTQDPVPPGGSFTYTVRFPDAGIYWYHPHHREDVLQDLGLYGNLLVAESRPGYYGPAHREEVLMLDDLLVGADGPVPYGAAGATHRLNGRFGNVLLVNGRPDFRLRVQPGEVVRFFLTNVSNTRTYNLSFGGARMKIVGSDVGNFEREEWIESLVLAPAERYVVHVRFDRPGPSALLNRVQAVDHVNARFFPQEDTLARLDVSGAAAAPDLGADFAYLRESSEVARSLDPYRELIDRPVERRLVLEMRPRVLPLVVRRLMQVDSTWFAPVEWSGTMPMMNWMSTGTSLEWVLRDPDTGREDMDIDWRFETGDVVKVRLHNRRDVLHAMHHPIHLHGQRFLVVEQDGVRNENLVWKDTVLIPVGSTIDILLDVSNPGAWMLHCHIAEHLEAGMKMVFHVDGRDEGE